MMSEKRFITNGYYINDTYHDGRKWLVNEVEAEEIVDVMNGLDMKARERSKALSKLQKSVDEQQAIISALHEESQDGKRRAILWWEHYKEKWANAEKELRRLKEENERLKQSKEILQQEISDTQKILEMLSEKLKGWNDE